MKPRGTFGLCYFHIAQLMTHSTLQQLSFTMQLCYNSLDILQRLTKTQKVCRSGHDRLPEVNILLPQQ